LAPQGELEARARTGDVDAWSALYAQHYTAVFRQIRYLCGERGRGGLSPPRAEGRAQQAAGGEARLSVRRQRGLLLALGLRVATRRRDELRLWRNRLQLSAGYAWRSGNFGVEASAGPTVEPWAVRSDGASQAPVPLGSGRATPLWGAAAALTPSLSRQLSASLRLRLGLRVDLAASAMSSGAVGRLLTQAPGEPAEAQLGLGGLELSTGLELTLWIAPPRPRS